jgi:tetratricopeptide (TPR) repeat protein
MGDKVVEIQNQIRNNAASIREYMDDLLNWEKEINAIDASLANKTFPLLEPVPVRASAEPVPAGPETKVPLKRDANKMQDYYKAWDAYDVDKELEKLDERPTPGFQQPKVVAKPQSKMVVRGGRAVSSEVDRLKDLGNLEFGNKEYEKAVEKYEECLGLGVPVDVQVVLYSNIAECWIRMSKAENAEEAAEKAIRLDEKHLKSILRAGKARKMMGKLKAAKEMIEKGLNIDPNNAALKQEIAKILKKMQNGLQELKEKMRHKKNTAAEFVIIPVSDINAVKTEEKKTEEQAIKAQTSRAIESISMDKFSIPKNLVEFERNWAMFTDPRKLKVYLSSIPSETVQNLFAKGNIESDFLMRVVIRFINEFTELQEFVKDYLAAIAMNKKISVLIKFLTRKEREKIGELVGLVGNPEELRVLI